MNAPAPAQKKRGGTGDESFGEVRDLIKCGSITEGYVGGLILMFHSIE